MISEIVQTKSGLSTELELRYDNKLVSSAYAKNNITVGASCDIKRNNDIIYHLSYDLKERISSVSKKYKDKSHIPYKIVDSNSELCGSICYRMSDGFFLLRYSYYELSMNNRTYDIYAVGMGKDGMKYPVYLNGRQVALVEKDCLVRNNLDNYTIYAVDESSNWIAWIFCSYLDMISYANRGKVAVKSTKVNYTITTNKELKNKYNPEFKNHIQH